MATMFLLATYLSQVVAGTSVSIQPLTPDGDVVTSSKYCQEDPSQEAVYCGGPKPFIHSRNDGVTHTDILLNIDGSSSSAGTYWLTREYLDYDGWTMFFVEKIESFGTGWGFHDDAGGYNNIDSGVGRGVFLNIINAENDKIALALHGGGAHGAPNNGFQKGYTFKQTLQNNADTQCKSDAESFCHVYSFRLGPSTGFAAIIDNRDIHEDEDVQSPNGGWAGPYVKEAMGFWGGRKRYRSDPIGNNLGTLQEVYLFKAELSNAEFQAFHNNIRSQYV